MKTILLVDDEKSIVEMMALFIEMNGYKVMKAFNGKDALNMVKSEKVFIDMVISDVKMPVMDGITLLQEIKKINPDVPVVLLISGFTEVSVDDAKKSGALDLLSKPVDLDNVLNIIKKTVG